MNLEQFAELAGEERITLKEEGGGYKSPFEDKKAYLVEILSNEATKSKNGFTQLKMQLAIVEDNDSLGAKTFQWDNLPVDLPEHLDEDGRKRMQAIYGRNLHNFLRAIMPEMFSVYARKEGSGRNVQYFDADGNPMSAIERQQRTEVIEKAVMGVAKSLQAGTFDVTGRRCYVVRVPHQNGNTYMQYYPTPPDKFPLAQALPF